MFLYFKSIMAINLGRRLLTATILIIIVWTAASFPLTWNLIIMGITFFTLIEYNMLVTNILEFLHVDKGSKMKNYNVICHNMIIHLNKPRFLCGIHIGIHLSMIYLNSNILLLTIGALIAMIFAI